MRRRFVLSILIGLLVYVLPISIYAQSRVTRLQIPVSGTTIQFEKHDNSVVQKILIQDYISSTKVVISDSEDIANNLSYFPYGSSMHQIKTSDTARQYTGQKKVSDDSLVYNYNARYYNPTTGIFIQPDSVEGPTRYTYVAGDPIMHNDPTGKCVQCTNPIMEQLVTGEHPWTATNYSKNPVAAIMGKLDAWTGIPSLIAFADRGHQPWYVDAVTDSKQYVSKSEAEMGALAQAGMAAASAAEGLVKLEARAAAKIAAASEDMALAGAKNSQLIPNVQSRVRMVDPSKLKPEDAEELIAQLININPDMDRDSLLRQFKGAGYKLYYSTQDDTVTGYAAVFPWESTAEAARPAYINKIHVGEQYRRKGFAKAILDRLEPDFDQLRLINIAPDEHEHAGMAQLYLRRGYKTTDGLNYVLSK